MIKHTFIIAGIATAALAHAGPVDLLEDNIGNNTADAYKVYSQCNGAVRFSLDLADGKLRSTPGVEPTQSTKPDSTLIAMGQYFGKAAEQSLIAIGHNPEQANFQAGMQTIYHLQLYQFAHSQALENTGDPWSKDNPFNIRYQSDMAACKKMYEQRK